MSTLEINPKSKIAKTPCKHCPWKKSSAAGGKNIPNFSMDMMRNLANTAPPRGSHEADFRPIFACHDSKKDKEYGCAGYAARDGLDNLSLRFMVSLRNINLREIIANAEQHDLYDNFYEMLDAFEKAQNPLTEFDHIVILFNYSKNKDYCALTNHIEKHAMEFEVITLVACLRVIELSETFVFQFYDRLVPLVNAIEDKKHDFDLKTTYLAEMLKHLMEAQNDAYQN